MVKFVLGTAKIPGADDKTTKGNALDNIEKYAQCQVFFGRFHKKTLPGYCMIREGSAERLSRPSPPLCASTPGDGRAVYFARTIFREALYFPASIR
jgi:hypothetical protein